MQGNNNIFEMSTKYDTRRNFISINVAKGFMAKVYEIIYLINKYNVSIVMLQDLGITEEKMSKHFIEKEGNIQAKEYVIPGYILIINNSLEDDDLARTAIAINKSHIDITKDVKIRKGSNIGKKDGRILTALIKTEDSAPVAAICIYAPNWENENEEFFTEVERVLYKMKKKNRDIILGGDFNATVNNSDRREGNSIGNNQWPSMCNEYGVDATHLFNPASQEFSWKRFGQEDEKADLDHFVIDFNLIEKCKTVFKVEDSSFSDHSPILLSTELGFEKPPFRLGDYKVLIDCNKLTTQTKLDIQKDLCELLPPIEEAMNEALEGYSEEDKLKFYGCVNEFASTVKEVALKHAPGEVIEMVDRSLPDGWTKKVRSLNRDIWLCGKLIEKIEEEEREEFRECWTEIMPATTSMNKRSEFWSERKVYIKEIKDRVKRADMESSRIDREKKELHRARMESLRLEVLAKDVCSTPNQDFTSELYDAGIPNKVVNRLAFLGVKKWEDIANWDGTDILPLAFIRTITKASGLGPIYWQKLRNYYVSNIAIKTCPTRELYKIDDVLRKEGVLLTLTSEDAFRIEEMSGVIFVEAGERGRKKFKKWRFNQATDALAVIIQWDKLEELFRKIISGTENSTVKATIRDINKQENVEKVLKVSNCIWQDTEMADRREIGNKMRELIDKVNITYMSSEAKFVDKVKEFKKETRREIRSLCRSMREEKVNKAVKRNNTLFKTAPGKLIKKRKSMEEGIERKKLLKVTDEKGTHTTKEEVLKSTFDYYTKTAAARPIEDDVKYDFLKICRESIGEIDKDSEEALLAPISFTETLRRIFHAGNGTAPGADGIPYEVIKTFPDCAIRMINTIQNAMLERAWCPDMFITGDVFLLAKTADPKEHKNWRPICLQSTIYKIMMAIMADRLLHFALKNNIISEEQKGFCPVSGCYDHPGLLLNIIENFRQNEGELYALFIDFFNAYGSVDHRRLLQVLEACKIPDKIIRFIECTLKNSTYRIHTGFGVTELITMLTGLKQGDPAAPVLFIIFLEALVRVLKKECVGYRFKYPFPHVVKPSSTQEFADDMLCTTDSRIDLEKAIDIIQEFEKWSNIITNTAKCGVIAVRSDGQGNIEDIDKVFRIGSEVIPKMTLFESYKYLGFCINVMGNPSDMSELIEKKLETNIKVIDKTPVHKWYKVTLAQWLLGSIPMYFLANGRVQVSRIRKWNKEIRAMVRKWIGARNTANAVIHLPSGEHGLAIKDIEDINDERKLTILSQFLHTNDARLRESTIANLRTELGRRRVITFSGYNVDIKQTAPSRDIARKYTMFYQIEKLTKKYELELTIAKESECWCVFPKDFYSEESVCRGCRKKRHDYCDPQVRNNMLCFMCRRGIGESQEEYLYPLSWKRYQDNRYNWVEQLTPIPNPTWELALKIRGDAGEKCKHHVFRHENGVWGVDAQKMKNAKVIKIKGNRSTPALAFIQEILVVLGEPEDDHLEIILNNKEVCNALGNWAYNWGNNYQRTSTGREPTYWDGYRRIIEIIKNRLPKVTLITFNGLNKEEVSLEEANPEISEVHRPSVGLHHKGKILNPMEISKWVKDKQVEKYREEWTSKRVQGMVGKVSGKRVIHTTYFISSSLDPEDKVTFMKLSLGVYVTKYDRKKWGLIEDATCMLCHQGEESIHHILTSCQALKHLHITRHNAILKEIMKHLVVLENLRMSFCDVSWDTIEPIRHNRPDIVIVTPTETSRLPKPFSEELKPDKITLIDITICWDNQTEERRNKKIDKYNPLLECLKRELNKSEGNCEAICVGVLGSIPEATYKTITRSLGVKKEEAIKILKEINITLVKENMKIWRHAAILNSLS